MKNADVNVYYRKFFGNTGRESCKYWTPIAEAIYQEDRLLLQTLIKANAALSLLFPLIQHLQETCKENLIDYLISNLRKMEEESEINALQYLTNFSIDILRLLEKF